MVPATASRERGVRRRPAADRERTDHFPASHCRVDDGSTRPAAPGPRARDRHGLRLPDGDPGAPRGTRVHDRAAARPAGRSGGAIPAPGPHEQRDAAGRRRGRLAGVRAVPGHHCDGGRAKRADAAHGTARARWPSRDPDRGPGVPRAGHSTARPGRDGGAARRRRAVRAPHLPARVHGGALDMKRAPDDLLGAHVSTQGGVALGPARGTAIGATAIQVFTKTPNQWREPVVRDADIAAFRSSLAASGIRAVVSHDSYLINLASPDDALRAKRIRAFTGELERCRALGNPWVVSLPGNYIDDRTGGLARNARAYAECLAAVPGEVGLLIEGTAGAGTALGSTFEELRALREGLPAGVQARVGFCLDTAHLHAAGYDVTTALEEVWERFDREVGLTHLKCLHLNDSKGGLGSRLDRHQWIGEGTIGPEPFRRITGDPRPAPGVKTIAPPKCSEPN